MPERFINSFSGGQTQDIDLHSQKNNTARYMLNGRVRFNMNYNAELSSFEQAKRGMTFAFCSEKGTLNTIAVCEGYEIIGSKDIGDALLLFSTQGNGGYSQIGIFTLDGDEANYTILYDDRNDPNGDKLNFRSLSEVGAQIMEVEYCDENEFIKRVYFNDGYNQERVFNLQLMYQEYNCIDSCAIITEKTPYHTPTGSCGTSSTDYPKHMSVHAFDSRMDLIFPKIKFKQRIDGTLKRGVYQYAMRYKSKDGHKSTWSLISRHIVVTGTHYPDHPEYLHDIAGSGYSHHNREMSNTDNDSITIDGLRITLANLDTRWDSFEVAYIYSKTDDVSHEANVFYTYDDGCGETPMPSSIDVDHIQHTGFPVAFEEFSQRFETIMTEKTMTQMRNRIYRGGVEILPEIDIDSKQVVIEPKFRYLKADETVEPIFDSKANPKSGKNDADVLTNSQPVNTTITLNTYNGNTDTLPIIDDYYHYKGQQVEHALTGYRRGETYGIGVIFFDRKGNTSFVVHLDDYTFPQQFDTVDGEEATLTTAIDSRWNLRIMGMNINGLKIPKSCLYDKFGKLNVSGFSIVRTKSSEKIIHQGIVIPVIDYALGECGDPEGHLQSTPHMLLNNKFKLPYFDGTNHEFDGEHRLIRHTSVDDHNMEGCVDTIDSIMSYAMYYSPDVFIEENYEIDIERDTLRHVGTCHRGYTNNEIPLKGSAFGDPTYNYHMYTKSYDTSLSKVDGDAGYLQYGRKKVGEETRLKFGFLVNQKDLLKKNFDDYRTDMTFLNSDLDILIPTSPGLFKVGSGVGVVNSVMLGMLDFEHIDIAYDTSTSSYRIMNYVRPNDNYYTPDGDNSLDTRQYFSTGHYQALTEDIVNEAEEYAIENDDNENIWFDDIEVWGGDTFVNFFDFTRIVPETISNCDQDDNGATISGNTINYFDNPNFYKEYATSMIVPIESKYNLALRFGRHFAKNATYAQQAYCDNTNLQFSGGIMTLQPESFSINKSLLHQENIQFFSAKPQDIKIVSKKGSSIYVSQQKVYSELEDSYRKQKVFDFTDLQGNNGSIRKLITLFNYLYCFQDYAYGIVRTSERAIVPSTTGDILLGTGKDLDGIDYISTEYGCQNPSSVIKFKNAIYWIDAKSAQICRHSQAGKDDLGNNYGLHDFLAKWCPLFDDNTGGFLSTSFDIIAGADYENNDIYFTFVKDISSSQSKTIAFNEDINIFQGFKSFIPRLYIKFKSTMMSVDTHKRNVIYTHNKGKYGHFYDDYYKTILEFIVNPLPSYSKVFDNGQINMDTEGVIRVGKITLSTQNVQHILYNQQLNVHNDDRFIYREDLLRFPYFELDDDTKQRLRGHYLYVSVEIDNENQFLDDLDIPVCITSWESLYRVSNRV